MQVVEIQLRNIELVERDGPVEVQLTVTSTNRRSHRRTRITLVTENTDLTELGRRDLLKSQL
jgi:hypothetical protein